MKPMPAFFRNFLLLIGVFLFGAPLEASSQNRDPNALIPESATFRGQLEPVSGIGAAVSGKTILIEQPWVGLSHYELVQSPVYFRPDGMAFSPHWGNVKWTVQDNAICLVRRHCYQAYSDAQKQAYVRDTRTKLLGRVTRITSSDSYQLEPKFQARQRQKQARARATNFFLGMLFEGLVSGGGAPSSQSGRNAYEDRMIAICHGTGQHC